MTVKNSPGKVVMQCMIWEPQPFSTRKQQDDQFVYNAQTLARVKGLPDCFQFFDDAPSSFFLKPIHVYRDTFLKIGTENLQSDRENMLDFNALPLYKKDGTPTAPWIYHQTFTLIGSMFSTTVVAPSDASINGVSKWVYRWLDVPFATNGKNAVNNQDDFDISHTFDEFYSAARLTKRIFPCQVAVSSFGEFTQGAVLPVNTTNPGSGSASATTSAKQKAAKPVHWLVEKAEPLFNMEDFFVEFSLGAYRPDIVENKDQFLQDFYFIDPERPGQIVDGRMVLENGIIADFTQNSNGLDTVTKIDLRKQPYYVIEIGKDNADHHYVIVLPYNGFPIFGHVGKVAIPVPSQGTDQTPAILINPAHLDREIGYKLSTHNVSCKELMDNPTLRITVRNHLGTIVVYFNDDYSNPWVIRRSDYDYAAWQSNQSANIGDFKSKNVYMTIPAGRLRIASGNILSGFTFGPLAYKDWATMPMPDAISVKGPVTDNDVNCFLREKSTRLISGSKVPVYFQQADVYVEVVNNIITYRSRPNTLLPSELNRLPGYSSKKNQTRAFAADLFGPDGAMASIIINKTSSLLSTTPSTTKPASGKDNSPKAFTAEFSLRAGDVVVGKGQDGKKWVIANCITPIATGWRLYVQPTKDAMQVCPVIDVAHHVLEFNSQWNFSDAVKVEHSGTIKFLMNFGDMTGSPAGREILVNQSGDACDPGQGDPAATDRTTFLAGLTNKTFFLRVYAWWEGGYMDCNIAGCPCKANPNVGNKRVVFTGMAHGGSITVSAGERTMECQLLDYWKILQDSQFLNSPFFDGMRDFNAVNEIMQMAGFSSVSGDKYPPRKWIDQAAGVDSGIVQGDVNGEFYWARDYALPASYDILQNPSFKFRDGEKLEDAIIRMARLSGKMVFFDRYGVFRMQGRPDQYFCNPQNPAFRTKCNFFASPKDIPSGACQEFDAIAIDGYSYRRAVADVPNEILIISTTPDGELLIASDVNLASKFDSSSEGYMGYTKRLMQVDGIFGSQEAVTKIMKYYKGFYRPPIIINWSSFGVGHLMAGDVVTFTGLQVDDTFPPQTRDALTGLPANTTTVYITSLNMSINGRENFWKNEYEGEWIFVGDVDCSQ